MNSGAPVPASSSAQRFSWRCRAGSTNAQICHSQNGLDASSPNTSEILSWYWNAPPTPVMISCVSMPSRSSSGRISLYGCVRKFRIGA